MYFDKDLAKAKYLKGSLYFNNSLNYIFRNLKNLA